MTNRIAKGEHKSLNVLLQAEINRLYREARRSPRPERLVDEEKRIIEASYGPFNAFSKAVDAYVYHYLLPLIDSILEIVSKIRIESRLPFELEDEKLVDALHDIALKEWEAAALNAYEVSASHVIRNIGRLEEYKARELGEMREVNIAKRPSYLLGIISEKVAKVAGESNLKIEMMSKGVPMSAPIHVTTASPLLRLILLLGALLGGLLLLGGIYLAFASRMAETKFSLFGNDFSSTSVGVSMVFIGAVLVILTFRRVLKSIDHLAGLPGK